MTNQTSPSIIKELENQKALLKMEYEHEKEEFCKQTEAMGIARKVKRGICWYSIRLGKSYYNSLNQLVVEVTRSEDLEVNHSFERSEERRVGKECVSTCLVPGAADS